MTNRRPLPHPLTRRLAVLFTLALLLSSLVFALVKWDDRFFSNLSQKAFLVLALLVLVCSACYIIRSMIATHSGQKRLHFRNNWNQWPTSIGIYNKKCGNRTELVNL